MLKTPDGTVKSTTSTTSNGEFLFPSVISGRYILEAWQGTAIVPEQSVSIFITKDGTITPAEIKIFLKPSSFALHGLIKLDSTKEPLGGIDISILQGTVIKATTTSTFEGKFAFTDLPSGLLTLLASGSDFLPATAVVQIFEDTTALQPEPEIYLTRKISIQNQFSIQSYLRDAYSAGPLEFVTVTLKGFASTITDRYGYFFLGNLAPGQYNLECTKEGFNQLNGTIVINSDGSSTIQQAYYMIYTMETGVGSVVGRYIIPNNETAYGLPVAIYAIHDISKDAEKRLWALTSPKSPLKTTVTGADFARPGSSDETGVFKFTHLLPTTEYAKYLIVVSEDKYSATATIPLEGLGDLPSLGSGTPDISLNPPSDKQFYFIVDVTAGKTTFVTNYEQENF
ncbi:MAG: Cna protein B-type domain protein [bacterium ADurb.Bin374]|nr:MAG: Cna protein B-type domain protein [bacterium ADurb.Bin374]